MTEMYRISFLILVISNLAQCYQDKVPEGFSLSVYHECGVSVEEDQPILSIMTDLSGASAIAHCRNGDFDFLTEDGIYLDLYPSFLPNSFYCAFDRLNNTNTYVLKVTMSWGNMMGTIDTHNREYVITCNFDEVGSPESQEIVMDDPLMAPKEIAHNMGDETTSKLSLDLVNVLDEVVIGSVQMDRYVRLVASTDGSNGEVGIKPVSCDAVGLSSGARHAIIRAGCGDGSVFTKEGSFITKGLKAYSPYFKPFNVNGEASVDFECNLTLCSENCDGSSCQNERRKRSELVHDVHGRRGVVFFIKTKPYTYQKNSNLEDNKANKLPNLIGLKTKMFDLSKDQDYVSRRQMLILITVLGFLVFLALLASFYNCFNDINQNDSSCQEDVENVETIGPCKASCPFDKPCLDTEPLPDINIISTSCP